MRDLPQPECRYGFTYAQLLQILGHGSQMDKFAEWMEGQTMALCLPDTEDDGEANHGTIVYPWDLKRFLSGGAPLD